MSKSIFKSLFIDLFTSKKGYKVKSSPKLQTTHSVEHLVDLLPPEVSFAQDVKESQQQNGNSGSSSFLREAVSIVESNLSNQSFSIATFAMLMSLSRTHLHRKLKSKVGMNASDFVRTIRLENAARLLEQDADSVSQIAYQVGFNHLSYFAKCFREQYGMSPSAYKKYMNREQV